MSIKIYRNALIAFMLTSVWTLYAFFTFLMGEEGFFGRRWDLLVYFLYSLMISCGMGLLMVFLRRFVFTKGHSRNIQENFLYVLTGIFNFYLAIIFLVATILGLLKPQLDYILLFAVLSLLFSVFILIDLQKTKQKPLI